MVNPLVDHIGPCVRDATMKLFLFAWLLCGGMTSAWAFDFEALQRLAAQRASTPYVPQDRAVPAALARLDYSQYTAIGYRQGSGVWRARDSKFYLQGFLRGYLFPERMRVNLVERGKTREYLFDAKNFAVDARARPTLTLPELPEDFGYSGFRVWYPVNRPDVFDEVVVFQGASYFRMLGKDQAYGLSARGIAVDAATPGRGEEFPAFTEAWVQQPEAGADRLIIYALLDGPSLAGAYEFTVAPGEDTVADVRAALFFRKQPERLGLAPLTSMYWYGESNYRKFVEFRPEVHDSDGVLLWNRDGSRIWRPLQTLTQSLVDVYAADRPVGFGLLQRDRAFASYADLEARYQARPSVWVEPKGDWGPGSLVLWQMPTTNEYADNVVAYWTPATPPQAGEKREFAYRLRWTRREPPGSKRGGEVLATYIKPLYSHRDLFRYLIEFSWDGENRGPFAGDRAPEIGIDIGPEGELLERSVKANPYNRSWRLNFVVRYREPTMRAPLRAWLSDGKEDGWKTEVWNYTMTPQGQLSEALGPW